MNVFNIVCTVFASAVIVGFVVLCWATRPGTGPGRHYGLDRASRVRLPPVFPHDE